MRRENCESPKAKPRVVAEVAQVAEVIGDALALEAERAQVQRARRHGQIGDRLRGLSVSPGIRHRAVAGHPAGKTVTIGETEPLETLLDALVHVAEPLLEPQHLFADHLEAEMPRLDDAGVNGAHRYLVHAVAADAYERVILFPGLPLRRRFEIAAQREHVDRPCGLPQPGPLIVRVALQAQKVEHRALHPVRRRKDRR